MRLVVDAAKCSGHGRCYTVAPDLLEADDEGFVTAPRLGGRRAPDVDRRRPPGRRLVSGAGHHDHGRSEEGRMTMSSEPTS